MVTVYEFIQSLEPGKRYYKPNNVSWSELDRAMTSAQFNGRFSGWMVKKMRGSMFTLACAHCGGTDGTWRH